MSVRRTKNTQGIPDELRRGITADFFSSAHAEAWFFARYYPDGYRCPECGAVIPTACRDTFLSLRRTTCGVCHLQPRATKGTILQDSRFTPQQLVCLGLLISFDLDNAEIARALRVSVPTVADWRARLAAHAEIENS
jgi:hypothetical protein